VVKREAHVGLVREDGVVEGGGDELCKVKACGAVKVLRCRWWRRWAVLLLLVGVGVGVLLS
jgi:hypothetical protein